MPNLCATLRTLGLQLRNRDHVALLVVVDVLPPPEDATVEQSAMSSEESTSNDSDAGTSPRSFTRADITSDKARPEAVPPSAEDGAEPSPGDGAASSLFPRPGGAARLVIANTHLLFNPKRGDIKMAQLMVLTQRVER